MKCGIGHGSGDDGHHEIIIALGINNNNNGIMAKAMK
jgi:hypothetical protein